MFNYNKKRLNITYQHFRSNLDKIAAEKGKHFLHLRNSKMDNQ
jgi:hypothetical protein